MLQDLLSVAQTAERLRVSPTYVHQLVAKKRLSFIAADHLAADEVERLALLMERLRHKGIAALVEITAAQHMDQPD